MKDGFTRNMIINVCHNKPSCEDCDKQAAEHNRFMEWYNKTI